MENPSPVNPPQHFDFTKLTPFLTAGIIILLLIEFVIRILLRPPTSVSQTQSMQTTVSPSSIQVSPTARPQANPSGFYQSPGGNYSVRYSPDQYVSVNEITSVDGVSVPAPNSIDILPDGVVITFNPTSVTTPQEYMTVEKAKIECTALTPDHSIPYILGGEPALLFEHTGCGIGSGTYVFAVHKNVAYEIEIINDTPAARDVLSSFTFTK